MTVSVSWPRTADAPVSLTREIPTGSVRARSPEAEGASRATFAIVSTRPAFDALEAEWNDLFERSARGAHVFQQFNWLWHWANHFLSADDAGGGGPQLAVVTGRVAGRLVLVWPLVISQTRFVRQVSWMGEPAGQYGDVLLDAASLASEAVDGCADDVLGASWDYLVKALRPDVVHLRKVRADSVVGTMLDRLGARSSSQAEAPYLALDTAASFQAYEERYSAKARKNRRRLMRRLGERAGIEIETYREGMAARELALLAVSLKRAWLHDRGQISRALADGRIGCFLADACDGRGRPTGARVSVLRSGGEPASIEVGFEAKGTLCLHIIVYSLKFEKSGAGVLHLEDGIRRSFVDGVGTLDLLAPRADYKMDWADGVVSIADRSLPITPGGHLYTRAYLGFARGKAKALAERLPMSLRRALG